VSGVSKGRAIIVEAVSSIALVEAQPVSFDIEQSTRTLSKIAYWKDALRARIQDVLDRFETVGINDGEFYSLIAEVNAFKDATKGRSQ
jgi:hypothetical protein